MQAKNNRLFVFEISFSGGKAVLQRLRNKRVPRHFNNLASVNIFNLTAQEGNLFDNISKLETWFQIARLICGRI